MENYHLLCLKSYLNMIFQFPKVYPISLARMIYCYLLFNHIFEEKKFAKAQQCKRFSFVLYN